MTRDDLIAVGFRLPASIIERVDVYARATEAKIPGVRLTRSNAIRALLELALTAEGIDAPEKPKRK